ncbi:MAG TPA: MMPL family transporter [Isosphaeraceae bacterium]|jgi:RND superfamily putative drug exporter|nr:MMPL family transporter [Isosphaeraceae bacterium]
MPFDAMRWIVCRYPGRVVAAWLTTAVIVAVLAPDLSRLAAEGQANLLPADIESARAAGFLREAWPDQWYASMAVAALHRQGGLDAADRAFAARLAKRFEATEGRPRAILRVLGPDAPKVVADRLISADGTLEMVAVPLETSFVSPASEKAIAWLQQAAAAEPAPAGLELLWTGDAVIGRDYMADVDRSLDYAAMATVFLLLLVLLAVYRSFWLALVPLLTIGVSLIISRGLLAWLIRGTQALAARGVLPSGWDVSPLVELFLVVILFGCGTDFCLFLSWRFGEHWNASNPAGAMRATLKRAAVAMLTSAGTVIAGLCLMGLTRFKLFSSTGPSVALGLALTVAATLSLTPALLVLLARFRPRAFAGLTSPTSGFWDAVGHKVLARPILTWVATLLVMVPAAVLGFSTNFIQDTISEMPRQTPSVEAFRLVGAKFRPGELSPLTVVLKADGDLRQSRGLALIDDVSRHLQHQQHILAEVRSATQPLGSPEPFEPARLAARLATVDAGFSKMADGARQLRDGLSQGAAKLRLAMMIEERTGLSLTGGLRKADKPAAASGATPDPVLHGLRDVSSALFGGLTEAAAPAESAAEKPKPEATSPQGTKSIDPRQAMLAELGRAADGADQIANGAARAHREIASILNDPVGRRALDRLLITPETIREHPDLLRSFAAYISPDRRLARFDLVQDARMSSAEALDEVGVLRRRLNEYLGELRDDELHPRALFTGANAESADIRALTRHDQVQTWIIVPTGVFLVLLLALRDPLACLNLVLTMILTYAFALGITHLVFVSAMGAEGLDWKVPYFLFVLLVAVGVDYNVFLMARLQEESRALGLRAGITRAVAQTGGLISSAAAITACSFASFLFSPLVSIRQLGFALVVGIAIDAALVRPVLVPCGQWLLNRGRDRRASPPPRSSATLATMGRVAD